MQDDGSVNLPLKMEAGNSCETLVSYRITTLPTFRRILSPLPPPSHWRWRQGNPPKRWYTTATLHVDTSQKTWTGDGNDQEIRVPKDSVVDCLPKCLRKIMKYFV